jgi:NAD(P)-dependent dehydrogenase (short-subunit alcohol dehydrogenase family)
VPDLNVKEPSLRLDGRHAVVTGASRGIGAAISQAMADAGAELTLVGRDQETLEAVAATIRGSGGKASTFTADLSQVTDVEHLCAACANTDILVNNAGAKQRYLKITDRDDEYLRDVFAVNFWAPYRLIRSIGPEMAAKGRGTIINISSMAAIRPFPLLAHYSAAKAALDMLTRVTAMELGAAGVRAVSIIPGSINTAHHSFGSDAEFMRQFAPAGHSGTPQDVARLAVFLASDAASYINGAVIECDGGAGAGYFHLLERFAAGAS